MQGVGGDRDRHRHDYHQAPASRPRGSPNHGRKGSGNGQPRPPRRSRDPDDLTGDHRGLVADPQRHLPAGDHYLAVLGRAADLRRVRAGPVRTVVVPDHAHPPAHPMPVGRCRRIRAGRPRRGAAGRPAGQPGRRTTVLVHPAVRFHPQVGFQTGTKHDDLLAGRVDQLQRPADLRHPYLESLDRWADRQDAGAVVGRGGTVASGDHRHRRHPQSPETRPSTFGIDRFERLLQPSGREAPPLCYSPPTPFAQMQQCPARSEPLLGLASRPWAGAVKRPRHERERPPFGPPRGPFACDTGGGRPTHRVCCVVPLVAC
jgi:hypothetical protein